MDGENNGKPYFLMDDLWVFPLFLETNTHFEIHSTYRVNCEDLPGVITTFPHVWC